MVLKSITVIDAKHYKKEHFEKIDNQPRELGVCTIINCEKVIEYS